MKNFKKILKPIVIILLIVFVCVDFAWVVRAVFGKKQETVESTVGSELKEAPKEDNHFFTFNYYSNKNNNGVECFEIKVNSYTDIDKTFTYGYGIQLVEPSFKQVDVTNKTGLWFKYRYDSHIESTSTQTSYYNTSNGIHYSATGQLNEQNRFLLDLGNDDVWMAKFKGSTKYQQVNGPLWTGAEYYHEYDCMFFVREMYDMVKTITLKNGVYENAFLLDIEKFFLFSKMNDSGKFYELTEIEDNIGLKQSTDIKNYMSCKISIFDDGMRYAKDSMFGQIGGVNENSN